MSEGLHPIDNVVRFPVERRRIDAYDAEQYIELVAPEGVTITAKCQTQHVFVNDDTVCQCGMTYRVEEGA